MPLSLHNKKIIISAGASGIGWATAKVCLSKGAIVYLCDIDNKSLNKIKKNSQYNKKLFAMSVMLLTKMMSQIFLIKLIRKQKKLMH